MRTRGSAGFINFGKLRNAMVEEQIILRGITDAAVIEAMRGVPRHAFVPPAEVPHAYEDCPVPIGEGQTISQPYMVALMTQCLRLNKSDRVLEIGTGSGYQTAVLAQLSHEVFSIERIEKLARRAAQNLRDLNYININIYVGDGSLGLHDFPHGRRGVPPRLERIWSSAFFSEEFTSQPLFDAIIITAAVPKPLEHLFGQMQDHGRMVMPVGDRFHQILTLFTKRGDQLIEEKVAHCIFVPLIGQGGWN